MKNVLKIIILLFTIPIFVKADYSIDNYRIDITVLENGDLNILEAFNMSGMYNGFERTIYYKGIYDNYIGEKIASTENKNLYDAKGLILNEVRGINYTDEATFLDFKTSGDLFKLTEKASKGDYGVYSTIKNDNYLQTRIYNRSIMNKGFYLDYILQGMIISHKDVSELNLNLFYNLEEEINNVLINIHIPYNKKILKAWPHNKDIDIRIVDNNNIEIFISKLSKNNSSDFRLIFDKEATYSNKTTNFNVLEDILLIEDELEEELKNVNEKYDKLRDEAYTAVNNVEKTKKEADYQSALLKVNSLNEEDELKTQLLVKLLNIKSKIEFKETVINFSIIGIIGFWFIGNIVIVYNSNKKRNYNLPSNSIDNAYKMGFLIRRRITKKDLIATVIEIMNKDLILYELNEDSRVLKVDKNKITDEIDTKLVKFLFGKENIIYLDENKESECRNNEKVLNNYSAWHVKAISESEKEKYYESNTFIRVFGIIYSVIGLIIATFFLDLLSSNNLYFKTSVFSIGLIFFTSIVSILFYFLYNKRTYYGKIEYEKCKSLKKSIKKIDYIITEENFKEIPYFITIGCFNKIADNKNNIENYGPSLELYKSIDAYVKMLIDGACKAKKKI